MPVRLNDSPFVAFAADSGGPNGSGSNANAFKPNPLSPPDFMPIPAVPNPGLPSAKVAVSVSFDQVVNSTWIAATCKKNGTSVAGTVSISPSGSGTDFTINISALVGASVGDVIAVTVKLGAVSRSCNCTAS